VSGADNRKAERYGSEHKSGGFRKMIAIIDYDAGNIFSVKNALDHLGFESVHARGPDDLDKADKLILPGVGAFPDAMRSLRERGLADAIIREAERKPLLGICLGAQLLFEKGYEFAETDGLGLIPGYVDAIVAPGLKIPHMGWNSVRVTNPSPLTRTVNDGDMVYFVHSYKAVTDEGYVSLASEYGQLIPALVRGGTDGQIYGAQFHPEKSGSVGLGILRDFVEMQG
jgi:glutamine amidotransferase